MEEFAGFIWRRYFATGITCFLFGLSVAVLAVCSVRYLQRNTVADETELAEEVLKKIEAKA